MVARRQTLTVGLVSWWDFEDGGGGATMGGLARIEIDLGVGIRTSTTGKVGNAVAKVNTSYLTKSANSASNS